MPVLDPTSAYASRFPRTCFHGGGFAAITALIIGIMLFTAGCGQTGPAGKQGSVSATQTASAGTGGSSGSTPSGGATSGTPGTPGTSGTPGVSGVVANIDFNPRGYGQYSQAALNNPTIGGVDIILDWSKVEPQQGVFNWAPADQAAAAWAAKGKKVVLIVRYVNEAQGGQTSCPNSGNLPAWEASRIPTFCDTDKGIVVPDYFNSTFQSDLLAFVGAIAQHFAASPSRTSLLYVRIGVGLAGEGFPLMPCGSAYPGCDYPTDLQQLQSWGYTPHAWAMWQERMLSGYQQAFQQALPHTLLIYPIVQLSADEQTGQPVQVEVAEWAANHGFGIGAQGLAPSSHYSSYANLGQIISYVEANDPHTFIQFQTVAAVQSLSDLQADVQNAAQLHAQSVEWYESDVTNPALQSPLQQWQQTAQATAR